MRALDTNVLVYAQIRSSPHHDTALEILTELADGALPWAIPWLCVYEFLRVVTHPRVYHPPVPLHVATADLTQMLRAPTVVLLSETAGHGDILMALLRESAVTGNLIHDAHIAALCLEHGVSEFVTGDRDFARFPRLKVHNPFT